MGAVILLKDSERKGISCTVVSTFLTYNNAAFARESHPILVPRALH